MKKIFVVNLVVFFLLFVLSETFSYLYLKNKYDIGPFSYNIIKNPKNEKYDLLRPIENRDVSKPPILLFGCSFIWGLGLEENQTFSYRLADYTNRTVVNRAYIGESPAFMYKQLSDVNTVSKIKEKLNNKMPEVIIFNFISDHFVRTHRYRQLGFNSFFSERYSVDRKNKLKRYQPADFLCFIHTFYTVILYEQIKEQFDFSNFEKLKTTNTELLAESYRLAKINFPDATFVIMNYPSFQHEKGNSEFFEKHVVQALKDKGINDILMIDVSKIFPDIYDNEYWLKGNYIHPSALAWEKLTPIIVEKLNLKD